MIWRGLSILLLVVCGLQAIAQDSIRKQTIDTVSISSTPIERDLQQQPITPELIKMNLSGSLSNITSRNTGIYIKNYGASNLATISLRGLGADKTQVIWNGMKLNSAMNGTIDLQTLPVALFDNIGVSDASRSVEVTAGSLGGALEVSSERPKERLGIMFNQEVGSFGTYNTIFKIQTNTGKWAQKLGLLFRHADNDYKYKNVALARSPEMTLTNSRLRQYGGVYELYHSSGFSYKSITTYSDRQIPPTMLTLDNKERQKDWLSLHQLQLERKVKGHQLIAQAAYKYDNIWYTNPLIEIDAPSTTHTLNLTFTASKTFHPAWRYTLRADHTSQWAESEGLEKNPYQHITGLFGRLSFNPVKAKWLTLTYQMRQDVIDDKFAPYLPAFIVNTRFKTWTSELTIERNYRYPTLNDRYWNPGGNPDLQAELGMNLQWRNSIDLYNKNNLLLNLSSTAYYMLVNNWIIWQPSQFGYWTPQNIKKVRSTGVENKLTFEMKRVIDLKLTAIYHYNNATNISTDNPNDVSEGKHLIYAPEHIFNLNMYLRWKYVYFFYSQNYTGLRYATSDNSQALDPYTTGDVRIGGIIPVKDHEIELYLSVTNIWNEDYQNLAWRSMPSRAFLGGITYKFVKR